MGCLARLGPERFTGADLAARRRAIELDRAALPFRVVFFDQTGDRYRHKIGVTKVFRAVRVSAPHRFNEKMVIIG